MVRFNKLISPFLPMLFDSASRRSEGFRFAADTVLSYIKIFGLLSAKWLRILFSGKFLYPRFSFCLAALLHKLIST